LDGPPAGFPARWGLFFVLRGGEFYTVGSGEIYAVTDRWFARMGYDYPETWGVGPFASITDCGNMLGRLYGADAFKWHCEQRVY
jgi:hypothetical protein